MEGYYIDTICSEEVNWNTVLTWEMQQWECCWPNSASCVFQKRSDCEMTSLSSTVSWRSRNIPKTAEFVVELDTFAKVNWGLNLKVISYGRKEKNKGLKSEKQLSYTWSRCSCLSHITFHLIRKHLFYFIKTIAQNDQSTYMYKTVVFSPEKE